MASCWRLQVRDPEGKRHVVEVPESATLGELKAKLAGLVRIEAANQGILAGFPLKPVSGDDSATLKSLGFRNGDNITVKRADAAIDVKQGTSTGPVLWSIPRDTGVFRIRKVPADNSCLFHTANFIFKKGAYSAEAAQELRDAIAKEVSSNPSRWTTAVLGAPNHRYCEIIRNDAIWGGGIELQILSEMFKCEILTFDLSACTEYPYGVGRGYSQRCFMVYTGKHYDPLVFVQQGFPDRTLFSAKVRCCSAAARRSEAF